MNYLGLINKVLRRLREDTVTSPGDSDYSAQVGEYVKQAVSEVEDSWDWSVLRTTIQVTTTASDFNYSLTGSGTGYKIFDVHQDTDDYDLQNAPYEWLNHQYLSHRSQWRTGWRYPSSSQYSRRRAY